MRTNNGMWTMVGWIAPVLFMGLPLSLGHANREMRHFRAEGMRPKPAKAIEWRTDYQKAVNEAQNVHLPIFLLCRCMDCSWADKLEQAIRQDRELTELLRERMVPVRLFNEEYGHLFTALRIERFPTLILASDDLKMLEYLEGFCPAEKLKKVIQAALNSAAEETPKPAKP